jgi:hypothetical protein
MWSGSCLNLSRGCREGPFSELTIYYLRLTIGKTNRLMASRLVGTTRSASAKQNWITLPLNSQSSIVNSQ